MKKLENKVAIITGASGGLGKGTAIAFAKAGASVVICARRLEKLREIAHICKEQGVDVLPIKCDVMIKEDLENLVDQTIDHFGRVDILVNNAISTKQGVSIMDHTDEIWNNTLSSGFEAVWHLMRLCYPYMKLNKQGRIINISSGAGLIGAPGFGVYAGVKAAVHGITMVAAREWGDDGITCNSLIPVFYSDLSNKLFAGDFSEEQMKSMIPLGYIGDVNRDIAPVLVFMASDDSRYITGQMIKADGGADIHF
ncbi:MAG: SDR family oxidoreductase [bacterium]|nr:SDR family oxidoreductase [bacterium]